jgi:class 3 adenylate cyclase
MQFPETFHDTPEQREQSLQQLQSIMKVVTGALEHYEGGLRQFIVDDKGTVLIAVFGMPTLSHEDDASRGVKAAMEMHQSLKKKSILIMEIVFLRLLSNDIETYIGVTTGTAFCGSVGSASRCEYSVVGDAVRKEKSTHKLICDR